MRSSSTVCFTRSLPLISSSPMFSSPTVGRSMWSTADASAEPITANCTSCCGVQFTFAPRSSTVTIALLRRQLRCDRRTIDAGQRLQHEARDRHQRAGVAGRHAGLRITVLDEVDRDAHRRVLLAAQSVRRRLVHRHDLACRMHDDALHQRRRRLGERAANRVLETHEDHARVRRGGEEIERRGNRHRRAVVPSHGVDCDRDGHGRRVAAGGAGVREDAGGGPEAPPAGVYPATHGSLRAAPGAPATRARVTRRPWS